MGSWGGGGLGSPSQALTANPWPQRAAVPWEEGPGGWGQAACGAQGTMENPIPSGKVVETSRQGLAQSRSCVHSLPEPSAEPSPGVPWKGQGTGMPTWSSVCPELSEAGKKGSLQATPQRSPQRKGLPARGQSRNPKSRLGAASTPSHRGVVQDGKQGHSRTCQARIARAHPTHGRERPAFLRL